MASCSDPEDSRHASDQSARCCQAADRGKRAHLLSRPLRTRIVARWSPAKNVGVQAARFPTTGLAALPAGWECHAAGLETMGSMHLDWLTPSPKVSSA